MFKNFAEEFVHYFFVVAALPLAVLDGFHQRD